MRQKKLLSMIIPALVLLVSVSQVFAQSPDCEPFNDDGTAKNSSECPCDYINPGRKSYCMSGGDYLAATLGQMAQEWLIAGARKLTGIFWLMDRWAAMLADFALKGDVWLQIRDAILESLQSIMGGSGGVLDQLVRGRNGMLYTALMVAGLVLILPFAVLSGQSPVKLERVIIWGVFMVALFISGTQGFDMIHAVEDLRLRMMDTIIGGDTTKLSELVSVPMMAHPKDALSIEDDDPLILPKAYATQYFPEISEAETYRFRVLLMAFGVSALDMILPGELMTTDAQTELTVMATVGTIRAGMTLVAAYVLLLVAIIMMMLSAASLVLIIFFIAALPLGFFEFGATLLGSLARQYLGIVTVSLFASVFVRIMSELGSAVFTGDDFSLAGMVVYMGGLGIVIIALHAGVKNAWKALSGSSGILQSSFASVGALTGSDQLPGVPGKSALNTAVTTAAAVGMGALTGGASVALMAGAGNLLGGSKTGRSAAVVAASTRPDSNAAQAFAAGALSDGSLPMMAGNLVASQQRRGKGKDKYNQQEMKRGTTASQIALADQDRLRLAPQWRGARNDGAYLTPDVSALDRAEQAFFDDGDRELAEAELAQAFGDMKLAARVLSSYENGGREAAEQIRDIVERTQSIASEHDELIDPDGKLDDGYRAERDRSIRSIRGNTIDQDLRMDISNASIRRALAVGDLEDQAQIRILASAVLDPENPAVQVGDTAAQYKLHDLAAGQGWDTEQLTALFDTERKAPDGSDWDRSAYIAEQLQTIKAFEGTPQRDLAEASRLAEMVADTTYVQVPAGAGEMSVTDGVIVQMTSPTIDTGENVQAQRAGMTDFVQQDRIPVQPEIDAGMAGSVSKRIPRPENIIRPDAHSSEQNVSPKGMDDK